MIKVPLTLIQVKSKLFACASMKQILHEEIHPEGSFSFVKIRKEAEWRQIRKNSCIWEALSGDIAGLCFIFNRIGRTGDSKYKIVLTIFSYT